MAPRARDASQPRPRMEASSSRPPCLQDHRAFNLKFTQTGNKQQQQLPSSATLKLSSPVSAPGKGQRSHRGPALVEWVIEGGGACPSETSQSNRIKRGQNEERAHCKRPPAAPTCSLHHSPPPPPLLSPLTPPLLPPPTPLPP